MNISVTDLANLIWQDALNQTSLVSIPEIAYWIRANGLGKLNNLIFTFFDVDPDTLEITPADSFGLNEAAILVQLYMLKFFQFQVSNFLGAVGISDIVEYSENGMTIRKLDRVRISQTWLALLKQAKEDLKDLLTGYKISKASPRSISGEEILLLSTIIPRYNRTLYQIL